MNLFISRRAILLIGLGALVLAAGLASSAASAATVIPLTLEQMEQRATDVFVGTVLSTRAGWTPDKRLIETRVLIRVDQRVKGVGRATATVIVPGGIVGDIGMRRPGVAVFKEGERVLLLAEPRGGPKGPNELRPVGLLQGKLRVKHDAALGIDVVEPSGPAWGARGERLAPGEKPKGPVPALALSEVISRLEKAR